MSSRCISSRVWVCSCSLGCLNGTDLSLMLSGSSVCFLKWQDKMSAVETVCLVMPPEQQWLSCENIYSHTKQPLSENLAVFNLLNDSLLFLFSIEFSLKFMVTRIRRCSLFSPLFLLHFFMRIRCLQQTLKQQNKTKNDIYITALLNRINWYKIKEVVGYFATHAKVVQLYRNTFKKEMSDPI